MASPKFSPDGRSLAFLKTIVSPAQKRAGGAPAVASLVVADVTSSTVPNVRVLADPSSAGDTDANLSLEERLRRERTRQLFQGVTSFVWVPGPEVNRIVYPRGGSLMIVDAAPAATTPDSPHAPPPPSTLLFDKASTGAEGPALDPKPSPRGDLLAFVQQDELYVLPLPAASVVGGGGGGGGGGGPAHPPATATRVTHGAREAAGDGPGKKSLKHGLADFIADEEFDRHTGFWWSPDGRYLAFQETDDSHIPPFRIPYPEQHADPAAGETHFYPFAGRANPRVRIGVVDVALAMSSSPSSPAPVVWMDTGADEDLYVVRVEWMPLGMGPHASPSSSASPLSPHPASASSASAAPSLVLQVLNRAQDVLDVVAYDATTGRGSLLLRETVSPAALPGAPPGGAWVNVLGQLAFLSPSAWPPSSLPAYAAPHAESLGGFLLWGSERTGHAQVYAYGLPPGGAPAYASAPRYAGPPKSSAAQHAPLHSTFARFGQDPGGGAGGARTHTSHGGGAGEGAGGGLGALLASELESGGDGEEEGPGPGSFGRGGGFISGAAGPGEHFHPPHHAASPLDAIHLLPHVGVATCLGCVTGRASSLYAVESIAAVAHVPGSPQLGPALYFTGTLDGPLERHLYCVPIFRGDAQAEVNERATPYGMPGVRRLTSGAGLHTVIVEGGAPSQDASAPSTPSSSSAVLIADTMSSLHAPPSLSVLRFDPMQRFPSSPVAAARRPAGMVGAGGSSSGAVGRAGAAAGVGSPLGASSSTLSSPRSSSPAASHNHHNPLHHPHGAGSAIDELLAPFSGGGDAAQQRGAAIPDLAGQAVFSFDRTGSYGSRMSAGVLLLGVLSGALPLGSSGTPAAYPLIKRVVAAAAARAAKRASGSYNDGDDDDEDCEDGEEGGSGGRGKGGAGALATSVSRALTGIAAVMQSGMSRLDNFGEALAAQLQQASAAASGDGSGGSGLGAWASGGGSGGSGGGAGSAGGGSAKGESVLDGSAIGGVMGGVLAGSGLSLPTFEGFSGKLGAAMGIPMGGSSGGGEWGSKMSSSSPPSPPKAAAAAAASAASASDAAAAAAAAADTVRPMLASPSAYPPATVAATSWAAADPSEAEAAAAAARANPPPLIVRLPAADGTTPLFASLFVPDPALHGRGPWPTVLSVYGGPHVQRVKADWAAASEVQAQALRREGFLVLAVDNRGSSRRGLAFEAELHRKMGTVEVDDQAAAVRAVIAAGLADPSRVGVYGWSYGGYMTLQCLAQHPGLFHAGVSGAPVTFWEGYDTGYTERYMGLPSPEDNAAGYAASSVLRRAGAIRGRLLLIHGLSDENVHARHSWAMVGALVAAGVPHDTLFLPGERHVVRTPASKAYLDTKIREHFARHLGASVAAPGPVGLIVPAGAGAAAPAPALAPVPAPAPAAAEAVAVTVAAEGAGGENGSAGGWT